MSKKQAAISRAERAAAAIQEQKSRERRQRTTIIGGIVLAVVAVAVVAFVGVRNSGNSGGGDGDLPTDAVPAGVDGFSIPVGEPDAPKTLALYEDLQCPACKAFEDSTGEQVRAAIDSGKIKVEYRLVSFLDAGSTNQYSSRALNAALAVLDTAGVDAFREFHTRIFAQQTPEGGPGHEDEQLIEFAVQSGAPEDEVRPQIEGKIYDDWIKNATKQMGEDGIKGTPGFKIDGKDADFAEVGKLLAE